MGRKSGDFTEDRFLNNLEEIATRAGFYAVPAGFDSPKKSVKQKFNPRAVSIPHNPMRTVLSETDWWMVYGVGHLRLSQGQIAETSSFCQGPPIDISSYYLASAARKLGLPDGKRETIMRWAKENPYEQLVGREQGQQPIESKQAPNLSDVVIPFNPLRDVLSEIQWCAVYGTGHLGLKAQEIAEILTLRRHVQIDFNLVNSHRASAAKKLGLPDNKTETIIHWAKENSYEQLVERSQHQGSTPSLLLG